MNKQNLHKRHQTWFVRLTVPPHLRATIGRRELIRTTKTADLATANRVKHSILAELKGQLQAAELNRELPKESTQYVLAAAHEARAAVLAGTPAEDAEMGLDASIENHLDVLRKQRGVDGEGDPLVSDTHASVIRMAHRVFAGEKLTLLSSQVENYLAEVRPVLRNQTVMEKVRALSEFQDWLKHDVDVSTVTRKMAGSFVTEVLMRRQVSAGTTKGTISHLSALWTWLCDRGFTESNPWERQGRTLKVSKRGKEAKLRPWTDAELLKLLKAMPKEDPLFALTALAAYTGARREEVCLLRKEDVQDNALMIREGKSAAAVRAVPIHPVIKPLVARLAKQTSDGYLIPGLLTGGLDDKRGHLLGKRFGYFIRSEGFTDSAVNFHSLRRAFINRCEIAGVPRDTVKLIVGHDRDDLTYGGYSPGVPLAELAKATAKATFGELDEYVKDAANGVKVDANKSHRRPTRRKGHSK
jgi:integrase